MGGATARLSDGLPATAQHFCLTVEQVVHLGRTPHATGYRHDEQIVQQVMAALDITTLAERAYPELSGGEKQRVQIARVLAQIWDAQGHLPRLLLLDEPMAALDWGHKQQLLRVLRALSKRGVTIVIVGTIYIRWLILPIIFWP